VASNELGRALLRYDEEKRSLPHIHLHPLYKWQREFLNDSNPNLYLTAANQVGKSSVQIIKFIHLATEPSCWPKFFPAASARGVKPNLFWYFYPDAKTLDQEFETKWKLYLPKVHSSHKKYGYKIGKNGTHVEWLKFNSGVNIRFLTYSQRLTALQAGTVFYVGLDEECPIDYLPELQVRTNSVSGLISSVFTATLGQDYWRRVMEPDVSKGELEMLPSARKMQISLFDCQNYEDGTSSHWTDAQITLAIERCTSEKEVLRRIMGKFVKESVFDLEHTLPLDRDVHLVKPFWLQGYAYYAGIDYGSGGIRTSQSSVFIIAVHPDYDRGYVVYHRRYDREQLTAQNLLDKLVEHASLKKIALAEVAFDYAAPDIGIIGEAMGLPISKANKRRKAGHQIFYSLLKENRIFWFDSDEVEFEKFSEEAVSYSIDTADKNKSNDDMVDAARYGLMVIPWAFHGFGKIVHGDTPQVTKNMTAHEAYAARIRLLQEARPNERTLEELAVEDGDGDDELQYWSAQYDIDG